MTDGIEHTPNERSMTHWDTPSQRIARMLLRRVASFRLTCETPLLPSLPHDVGIRTDSDSVADTNFLEAALTLNAPRRLSVQGLRCLSEHQ